MRKILLFRKYKNVFGQSTIEYFIIFTVLLAVILSTGFIGRMRDAFNTYFNRAVEQIVPGG